MELKHDIYVPDLSNIRQKEVVMYTDIDNNYNAFVKKLISLYKQEHALIDGRTYWGFPNGTEVDEIYDNKLRINILCSEYLNFAQQVDFKSIIAEAQKKYIDDSHKADEIINKLNI
jgi:hypothetical protein